MKIASGNYQEAYFSVPVGVPGLAAYSASSGVNSLGLAGSATFQFNPQWAVTGYARWDRLIGDAADSPIVTQTGSANQWTFGAIVAYSFDIKIP
jgi:outer membrane protein